MTSPRTQGLARGGRDLAAGYRFLAAHPRLWGWVVAPALVTLAVMIAAVIGVAALAAPVVDWVAGWMPSAIERWAGWLVWAITIAALGFVAVLLFVPVVGVIAGPWNELLAQAITAQLTGVSRPRGSVLGFVRDAAIDLVRGLGRLGITVAAALGLLALSLVPVIGTIGAALIGAWLTARGAAFDCYDAALAGRDLPQPARRALLDQHRHRTLGLGAAVAALMLVPGVNLVALGVGTAGATLAAHELAPPAA